jgi:ubiquinone/menaquinone biosynthesis C-methylase UbiE
MSRRFDYDESDVDRVYDEARALPVQTLQVWLEAIAQVAEEPIRVILDVGCGSGRFTAPLAQRFSAQAIGVDPSSKLLAVARSREPQVDGVSYLTGSAEHIPIAPPVDLVFMSMVYHHLEERTAAWSEVARVLRHGGRFVVRNTTREDIDANALFSFFPAAAEIERRRMPSARGLQASIEGPAFRLAHSRVIEQVFAPTHREYYRKVALRGLSALQMISDDDFQLGLEAFRRFTERPRDDDVARERVHLFAFERLDEGRLRDAR